MAILNTLLGNGSKDRVTTEEMRALLAEMRQERQRFEALIESSRGASDSMHELVDPIAKAATDIEQVTGKLAGMEQRLEAIATLATQIQTLDDRCEVLVDNQKQVEANVATILSDSQQIRTVFEELSEKVDVAVSLKDRLESFLEVEKPFALLRGDAEALRTQVDGTGEHMARLREQHERLMDAHKLAVSKMEALDRRREELSRDMSDKERRVAGLEAGVRGLDGIRNTVDELKRDMGMLKALGDSLGQKTAALEAQRDAVERALSQADSLERAMRQLDTGVRQQVDNEKSLTALAETVADLRTLHEEVIERSREIAQLGRQADEQTSMIRHEMAAARDEMKNSVERFDFESKGLESVSERVADLRGTLSDFENRFRGLKESSQTVAELNAQTHTLSTQLQTLAEEVHNIDEEARKLNGIRRDLDEAIRTTRELAGQVTRIDQGRSSVEAVLREFEQLGATQAVIRDAHEQMQAAHAEIGRMRNNQSDTRSWLIDTERSLSELRAELHEIHGLAPSLEIAKQQTERLGDSLASIESRRGFVEDMQRRIAELGATSSELDDRSRQLQDRMDAAEQRFVALAAQAEEAERLSQTVANVSTSVGEAARQTATLKQSVAAFEARCESVEDIAERTESLRRELDQRQQALEEAAKNLKQATLLRQEAATSAQELNELSQRLGDMLSSAGERATHLDQVSSELEQRATHLQRVDKRLGQFEERLAKWEYVDQEVSRSLEQIVARQGTVQALQGDLDRMFTMAEQTSADVRTITSAHREIAESRALLNEVTDRLKDIRNTETTLGERERQLSKAEERLARAEGLLVDIRASMESLQGQKAIVDQAVEKTGSLRFLLKQAEAMIDGLRDERSMTTHVREAVSARDDEEDAGYEEARAA